VMGLWGPNEAAALERALLRVSGVARAEVDLVSHQAVVHYGSNACVEGLARRVKAQGWQVTALVQRRSPWERVFSALVLTPLILSSRLFGERAWWIWGRLTVVVTRLIIWLARPYLRRQGIYGDDVRDLMRLVDLADELMGAEGEWLDNGPGQMVKRIRACPHAERLKENPAFCTRLGAVMGQVAFRTYAPLVSVRYIIPKTMSQGDPYCEYVLIVED
jgi:hypothetical protein